MGTRLRKISPKSDVVLTGKRVPEPGTVRKERQEAGDIRPVIIGGIGDSNSSNLFVDYRQKSIGARFRSGKKIVLAFEPRTNAYLFFAP